MDPDEYIPPIDLRAYAEVLRRRWRTVAVMGLAGLALASAYTFRLPDVYRSQAAVLVEPVGMDPARSNVRVDQSVNLFTERELAASGAVGARVAAAMDDELSVEQVLERVDIGIPGDTQILLVGFWDTRADRSQEGARLVASYYLEERRKQAEAGVAGVVDTIMARLAEVEDKLVEATKAVASAEANSVEMELARGRRDVVIGQIAQLHAQLASAQALVTAPGRVISPATAPVEPFGPPRARHLASGLFLGLLGGVILAMLRERVDDRVRRRSDMEDQDDLTLLGVVPLVSHRMMRVWGRDPLAAPEPVTEAHRRIRATLSVRLGNGSPRSLMVTSATGGEGKSTTAAGLATSFARSGVRTLLIGGDLRQPSIHQLFGIENDFGLAEVMVGLAEVRDAAQAIHGLPTLAVMPAGHAPMSPGDLLQQHGLTALLEQADDYDLVIVDAPRVEGLADALVLGRQVDATLMVVRDRVSRVAAVKSAVSDLARGGAVVLGVVMLTEHSDPVSMPEVTRTIDQSGIARPGLVSSRAVRRDGAPWVDHQSS